MIITRTPYRVSFFGGGSDYSRYYEKHGGCVLSTTIDQYCYINLRLTPPLLGTRYRIIWSEHESCDHIEHIRHAGVRGCLQYMSMSEGLEVNHAGDLPARSGLGSSSAFTVGMLHALHAFNGDRPRRAALAHQAIAVEQNVLQETVGIQDQIACAWGGLNLIRITTAGTYSVEPIVLLSEVEREAEHHFLLAYTGIQRHASEIAAAQVNNVERKQAQLRRIVALVEPAADALRRGRFREFGELLNQTWNLKRQLSDRVSNDRIDDIYAEARTAGAYGGKILGAGGGGFMLLCMPPNRRQAVINAIGLICIPFKFEHGGSQIVLAE